MDSEVAAMGKVTEALDELDEVARVRVLRWAGDRYGMTKPSTSPVEEGTGVHFSDFADLYSRADPSSEAQKALIAGYWVQVVGAQETFESQSLNTELKNLGHGVKNITDALDQLIERKPRLVIQVRKSGTTRQARKRYKLTVEGIRAAERLLKSDAGSTGGD